MNQIATLGVIQRTTEISIFGQNHYFGQKLILKKGEKLK